MNTLLGEILEVKSYEALSLVKVQVGEFAVSTIVIDTPETSSYLVKGKKVNLLFKETEVAIGIDNLEGISLQNQLHGTIERVDKGNLLSKISLSTSVGTINSVITTNAVKKLGLVPGKSATALIKTNEVMLSYDD